MGQKHTLHTPEEIIAAGGALEAANPGKTVTAWEIHKKLGGRGNYPRLERIWEEHVATSSSAPAQGPAHHELPEQLVTGVATALETTLTAILSLMDHDAKRRTELYLGRMQVQDSQHANEMARKMEENANWREEVIRLVAQVEELTRDLEQERALRRAAEQAAQEAAAARTVTWRLPVVGESIPLVSPTRVAPLERPVRPEPIASRHRRGSSRSEAHHAEATEVPAVISERGIPPVLPADPDQIELPI